MRRQTGELVLIDFGAVQQIGTIINVRGNVLKRLARNEEAITSFDKVLEIKPDYHHAWYN